MNDHVVKTLCDVVGQYGVSVGQDPRRCEALLKDVCPGSTTETNVLVAAVRDGVPAEIVRRSQSIPVEVFIDQLTDGFVQRTAISRDAARWGVVAWAQALGVGVPTTVVPTTVLAVDAYYNPPQSQVSQQSANTVPDLSFTQSQTAQPANLHQAIVAVVLLIAISMGALFLWPSPKAVNTTQSQAPPLPSLSHESPPSTASASGAPVQVQGGTTRDRNPNTGTFIFRNRAGYELVARIAWDRLDAAQRGRLVEILRAHPAFPIWKEEAGVKHPPDLDRYIVGRAAAWPDDIRGRQPDNPYRVDEAEVHADWHYIDHGLTFDGIPLPVTPSPNILTALLECDRLLRAPETPAAERATAMAWLLHLIGDAHQPLHCAVRFSRELPRGDLGGNRWMVRLPDGTQKNLHAFWDDLVASDSDQVESLAQTLPATVRDLPPFSDRLTDWIKESLTLARTVAYDEGRVPGVAVPDPKRTVEVREPLSPAYCGVAARVARMRVVAAGLRLHLRLCRYLRG